jgi:hypothetical protein
MVVKAAPSAPLVMAKTQLLLEVLVVPLDAPAQFCGVDQIAAARSVSW